MNKSLRVIKYLGVFVFFIVLFTFICSDILTGDSIWSYGFSHAISKGLVPYLDFNTISTPLYSFLLAIPLLIWDNLFMFVMAHSAFCTLLVYLVNKYSKNGWFLLLVLAFPIFKAFLISYNFLCLVLILLLFILENKEFKYKDFIIGIVLGLLILTKQTVGGISLIFSFILLKDFKRIGKRLVGVCIPGVIFLIYLLITGSFYNFLDLCLFGLFDFNNSNGNFNIISLISYLLLLIVFIAMILKKDIKFGYVVGSFFFVFPLFDMYHFSLFLMIFCLSFIDRFESNKYLGKVSFLVFIVLIGLNILIRSDLERGFLKVDKFECYLLDIPTKNKLEKVIRKYKEYDNAIMVGDLAMISDVSTGRDISYFDVTLKGNYGYDGTNKMIKKFDKLEDIYIFIDVERLEKVKDTTQLDYNLLKHIIKNSKEVDGVSSFKVYYKE